mmetsp:Transcript_14821/g.12627  ORF Transcript_14821/g.12627 Transcript_14821/m.12627 type:complete len:135 (-) Transcript_14821:120-524(-)
MSIPKVLILARNNNKEVLGTYRVHKRGSITFSLKKKTFFRDATDPMQKMGIYSISPSFRTTWNARSRYNASYYDRIEKHELEVTPEKSLCVADIVSDNLFMEEGKEGEYYEKTIHGIEALEVFEVENDNNQTLQ